MPRRKASGFLNLFLLFLQKAQVWFPSPLKVRPATISELSFELSPFTKCLERATIRAQLDSRSFTTVLLGLCRTEPPLLSLPCWHIRGWTLILNLLKLHAKQWTIRLRKKTFRSANRAHLYLTLPLDRTPRSLSPHRRPHFIDQGIAVYRRFLKITIRNP